MLDNTMMVRFHQHEMQSGHLGKELRAHSLLMNNWLNSDVISAEL